MIDPFSMLRNALRTLPVLRYAMGVAGLSAATAVAVTFGRQIPADLDGSLDVVGPALVPVGMILLIVVGRAARLPGTRLDAPALVLVWSVVCAAVVIGAVVVARVLAAL